MTEKVDFVSGCPAFNCDNGRKSFNWVHHNCGGHEWLFNDGYVKCKNCNLSDMLISWKFKCTGHSDFREVNREKICEILSMCASLEKGSKKFKKNLLNAVSDMIDDDDN
jgi:hypothetical protein